MQAGLLGTLKIRPKRLAMMQRVADGIPQIGIPLWHFNNLTRCDEILSWLIKQRITGKEFQLFMKFYCEGSILNTAKEILRRIDANEECSPILVGRDFIA